MIPSYSQLFPAILLTWVAKADLSRTQSRFDREFLCLAFRETYLAVHLIFRNQHRSRVHQFARFDRCNAGEFCSSNSLMSEEEMQIRIILPICLFGLCCNPFSTLAEEPTSILKLESVNDVEPSCDFHLKADSSI